MFRSLVAVCAILLLLGGTSLPAQDPGFFNLLDQNGNGQIDPEEWQRVPSLKEFVDQQGGVQGPIGPEEFVQIQEAFVRRDRPPTPEFDGPRPDEARPAEPPREEPRLQPATLGGTKAVRGSGRTRAPVVLSLPDEFKSHDKNLDGQIGLYEWSRSDLGTFRKLDLDGDGFLTPGELTKKGTATVALASPTGPGTPSPGGPEGRGNGAGRDRRGPFGGRMGGGGNDSNARAELTFGMLDRNRDGTIDTEEFARSRTIRPQFERASIDVSKSMTKEQFLENFKKVNP